MTAGLTELYPSAGGCWSDVNTMNLPMPPVLAPPYDALQTDITQSSTPECGDREVIFIMIPFHTNQTTGSIAQLCEPKYFVAYNVTTFVSDTPTGPLVSIDDEGFDRTKVDLDSSTIDLHTFETQFLDPRWANYFRPPDKDLSIYDNYSIRPSLGGSLILLAATMADPGSDLDPIFDATGFLEQARRRFFREVLHAAFVSVGTKNAINIVAQVTATKMRLLVETSDRDHFRCHSLNIGGYGRPRLLLLVTTTAIPEPQSRSKVDCSGGVDDIARCTYWRQF